MKFTLDRSALNSALRALRTIAPSKAVQPIYGDVLIDIYEDGVKGAVAKLSVVDRSFIVFFSVVIDVAVTDDYGQMAFPVDELAQLVGKATGASVDFEYNSDKFTLQIVTKQARATIKGHDPTEYMASSVPETEGFSVDLSLFTDIVSKTVHASGDERVLTKGLFLEFIDGEMTAACLDGQRMACTFNRPLSQKVADCNVLIPANEIKLVASLFEDLSTVNSVQLFVEESCVYVYADNVSARIGRMNANFPDFRLMIPEQAGVEAGFAVKTRVRDLLSAVDWVSSVDSMRLEVDALVNQSKLILSAYSQETGDAVREIGVEVHGFDTSVVTFSSHVLTQLRVMSSLGYESVYLLCAGDGMPVVIQPAPDESGSGSDYITLVMPVASQTRIQQGRPNKQPA